MACTCKPKTAYKERVRRLCHSQRAQSVASNIAKSWRKTCSAVVKANGGRGERLDRAPGLRSAARLTRVAHGRRLRAAKRPGLYHSADCMGAFAPMIRRALDIIAIHIIILSVLPKR